MADAFSVNLHGVLEAVAAIWQPIWTHARLSDDSVVELVKDCGCLDNIHAGPHWLHDDCLWRLQNQRTLMSLQAQVTGRSPEWFALYDAYVAEERERIREKVRQMKQRGIEELL